METQPRYDAVSLVSGIFCAFGMRRSAVFLGAHPFAPVAAGLLNAGRGPGSFGRAVASRGPVKTPALQCLDTPGLNNEQHGISMLGLGLRQCIC